MPEILTESFCERCGTRYAFEAPARKVNRLARLKVLSKGVRNYVMSDESSLREAFTEAQLEEERELVTLQIDAFQQTFNFCLSCRQYTCPNCWNEAESRCLTCAPSLGRELLPPAFPDLAARPAVALSGVPDTRPTPGDGRPAAPPQLMAEAWPRVDLFAASAEQPGSELAPPVHLEPALELLLGPGQGAPLSAAGPAETPSPESQWVAPEVPEPILQPEPWQAMSSEVAPDEEPVLPEGPSDVDDTATAETDWLADTRRLILEDESSTMEAPATAAPPAHEPPVEAPLASLPFLELAPIVEAAPDGDVPIELSADIPASPDGLAPIELSADIPASPDGLAPIELRPAPPAFTDETVPIEPARAVTDDESSDSIGQEVPPPAGTFEESGLVAAASAPSEAAGANVIDETPGRLAEVGEASDRPAADEAVRAPSDPAHVPAPILGARFRPLRAMPAGAGPTPGPSPALAMGRALTQGIRAVGGAPFGAAAAGLSPLLPTSDGPTERAAVAGASIDRPTAEATEPGASLADRDAPADVRMPRPDVPPSEPPHTPAVSADQIPSPTPDWTMVAPEAVPWPASAIDGGPGAQPTWPAVTVDSGSSAPEAPASWRPSEPAPPSWATGPEPDSGVWAISSRDVIARAGSGVQACVSCGLPLSVQARFCRRCGTRQG